MPNLLIYNVFISHSWKYNDEYNKLIKYIEDRPFLRIRNLSVPIEKPILLNWNFVSNKILHEKLDNKIKLANIFIVFSWMYVNYSKWIEKEIELAKKYNKPILVIKPYWQILIPKYLLESWTSIIWWNYENMVNEIRRISI